MNLIKESKFYKKIMKHDKLTFFFFITTILFFATTLNFLFDATNLKYRLKSIEKIPHIELKFSGYDIENVGYMVDVTGFVAFENPEDQPRRMRQYNKIDTDYEYDFNKGKFVRVFTGEDIIKMDALEPRSMGVDSLTIKEETSNRLVLENEYGVIFTIDKIKKEVFVTDPQGDLTYLVTNFRDYQDFIEDRFYK